MSKFYYKTLVFGLKGAFHNVVPDEEIERELNRLGELGWELVSSSFIGHSSKFVFILKNSDSNLSN